MYRKITAGLFIVILTYIVAGFTVLPYVLKPVLTHSLSDRLHREVTIEDIDTNPCILSARVTGLVIKDREDKDTFVSFEELYINLQTASAFKQAPIIKEMRLLGPYVNIVHTQPGQYNFSDLIDKDPAPGSADAGLPDFFLGNIQVTHGRIDVKDVPKDTRHTITGIALSLPFLSNIGEHSQTFVQPHFEATVNGTRTVLEGRSKPFHNSLETIFELNLTGIDIPYYLEYLPQEIEMKIPSGTLDLQATVSYTQFKDKPPVLEATGKLGLSNLTITDKAGLPLVSTPRITVDLAPSLLLERSVHLAGVEIASPAVNITRDTDGKINFIKSVKSTPAAPRPVQEGDTPPFSLTIDKAALTGCTVTFTDSSTTDPVKLTADHFDISAQNISTTTGSTGTAELSCKLNKSGSVSTKAAFSLDPFSCEAQMNIAGVEPAWIQPYFADRVHIIISKGSASTKGTLVVKQHDSAGLAVSYAGDAELAGFASVDKGNADEFIAWKSLRLEGLDLGYNPTHVAIDTIALTDPFSRIIVNEDGRLNLSTIVARTDNPEAPEQEQAANGIGNIQIGTISLTNANLSFLDRNISPHYATQLSNLEGAVTGLTSQEATTAAIHLSGRLDNASPLLVEGMINPLRKDPYADLHVNFKDIDLTPESPYAGKYLGYAIRKGKLSLDLTYLIEDRKLDSQNDIFIDQFSFGDAVDSPDKTKLPVKFAVSLLKDPQGKINLSLPVAGYTDDPEFRVGKIIARMLANIIKKAASSPFNALAALYPGAEELDHVEFGHGSAALSAGAEEKLDVLLQILSDKPSLSLDIRGYADRDRDKTGLIQYLFEKKLKSQKLMDMLKKGSPAVAVDEITIETEEFERYLKKAYKAETFEKPKNALGLTRSLPAEEMQSLIIGHIEVGDDDLGLLAAQRALQVKNYLIRSQKVNPERIFLIGKQPLAATDIEGVAISRVDLTLR